MRGSRAASLRDSFFEPGMHDVVVRNGGCAVRCPGFLSEGRTDRKLERCTNERCGGTSARKNSLLICFQSLNLRLRFG